MDTFLEFAKTSLFRFTFAIMLLGMLRLLFITFFNAYEAKSKSRDKTLPTAFLRKLTIGYVIPVRSFKVKPIYSIISIIFHICLLITPLFLYDHALLFENSVGISWISVTLSKGLADWLTRILILSAFLLIVMRLSNKTSRMLSTKQEYLWLILLSIPFITGYLCANLTLQSETYNIFMLTHILSAELIFVLLPFSKIAHCILMPFSQWITQRSWKFQAEGPEAVNIALGKEGDEL